WTDRLGRLDPVGPVVLAHAVTLWLLDGPGFPAAVLMVGLVLAAGRAWITGLARRRDTPWGERLLTVRGVASIVLAYLVVFLDGGTESPFFFWPLLILAWEALTQPMGRFRWLLVATLASHVGVVAALGEVTPASVTRIGLLAAFWAALGLGRRYLIAQQLQTARLGDLVGTAFATLPIGIIVAVLDPPTTDYVNPAAEALGITSLSSILVRPWQSREPGSVTLADFVTASLSEAPKLARAGLLVVTGDVRSPRFLRVHPSRYRHHNGGETAVELVVVSIEDVTLQVAAGEERRRFLEEASHQLRTPLTPIIGYAHLLADGAISPGEIGGTARDILDAATHLDRLFERMRTVTRLQQVEPLVFEEVSLPTLWQHHCQPLDPELAGSVSTSGDPDLRVRCHPPYIARALYELLDNSRSHGVPPIALTWQADGDHVLIEVTDAGAGPHPHLPADEVLPFAAWASPRPRDLMSSDPDTSTGLGLYLAASLTTTSEATLTFQRRPDHWAFTLQLPQARKPHTTAYPATEHEPTTVTTPRTPPPPGTPVQDDISGKESGPGNRPSSRNVGHYPIASPNPRRVGRCWQARDTDLTEPIDTRHGESLVQPPSYPKRPTQTSTILTLTDSLTDSLTGCSMVMYRSTSSYRVVVGASDCDGSQGLSVCGTKRI
ncbi:MAG: HAMP domain-containing sensor histidine kinase, partial [Acidimicrobiia bacterium]